MEYAGEKARWVGRGEKSSVAGRSVFAGMFYLGKRMAFGKGMRDKFAVDPSLPLGSGGAKFDLPSNSFDSSYASLPPAARLAFLEWMDSNRRNPNVPVQFRNIFIGGLSCRVFEDRADDVEIVVAEARRMMNMYLTGQSSGPMYKDIKYARNTVESLAGLIAFASGIGYQRGQKIVYDEAWQHTVHVPAVIQLRIADLMTAHKPIMCDDAFHFAHQHAKISGVARIDPRVIKLLWDKHFNARYPNGITVNTLFSKLKLFTSCVDGSSKAFAIPVPAWCQKLSDPKLATGFCSDLAELYKLCAQELSGYRKAINANPAADGTLAVVRTLPKELLSTSMAGRYSHVKAALDQAIERQGVVTSKTSKLLEILDVPAKDDADLTAPVIRMITQFLDRIDVAMEPDSRFGTRDMMVGGSVVLYRGHGGMPVDSDEPAYFVHRSLADFAITHMRPLGEEVNRVEQQLFLMRYADRNLNQDQKVRLAAYTKVLIAQMNAMKPLSFRSKAARPEDIETILSLLVALVASIQEPRMEMINAAEKFIRKLDGDASRLHSAIHKAAAVDSDGLVTVISEEVQKSVALPKRPDVRSEIPAIDKEMLQRLERETATVSVMLSAIFSENDPPEDKTHVIVDTDRVLGLDKEHSELLSSVMSVGTMDRNAFEKICRSLGLMPDGAIEVINDAAFDEIGEAVLIDSGSVIFEEHLRVDIQKTGANR